MIDSNFYLGRVYDPASQIISDTKVTYDPADLTTHAVVTGMTGSGKTGLCVALLEEAALKGIPAIIIDPKGDLTNLLLHFPDLAPQDFQPWIDSEQARRAGKTIGQPRIVTRGFVYAPKAEHLLAKAGELVRSTAAARRGTAPGKVEAKVEQALSGLFYRETKQKPVVTVALVEVQSK